MHSGTNSACSTQAGHQQGPKGGSEKKNPTKESEVVILFALTHLSLPVTEDTQSHESLHL